MVIRVMQLISSLQVGGAEKLLLSLLDSNDNTQEVRYVVVVMNSQVNPALKKQLEALNHTVYFLERKEGHWHPRYLFKLLHIIQKHHINILHAHNYGSKSWAMLCKLLEPQIKVIATIHDTPVVSSMNLWALRLHKTLVDMNIAVSEAVERECLQYGLSRCIRIYNGIPISDFARKATLLPRKPMRIINVARMEYPKKGQDILIDAVKLCLDQGLRIHCRLVGSICHYNKKLFDDLKKKVADNGLQENVEFIVNRTDVSTLLREADVFVLPSRFEGFGLVLLEAMATGLPVIASNIDGPRELVRSGVTGYLFYSGDARDLAEKIQAIYEQPEITLPVISNAWGYVQQFDISRMRTEYQSLYRNLLTSDSVMPQIQPWRLNNELPV